MGRLQASSLKLSAWLLVVAVSSIIIFICIAGYNRKETVVGYLAPAMGTAEIFVPQQGTVTEVQVTEDQTVDEGDVLLTIDTSQITADGLDVNAAVLKSLSVQKMVLSSQIEAEDGARSENDRLAAAIRSGEAELELLTSKLASKTNRSPLRRNSSRPRIRCRLRAICPPRRSIGGRKACSMPSRR